MRRAMIVVGALALVVAACGGGTGTTTTGGGVTTTGGFGATTTAVSTTAAATTVPTTTVAAAAPLMESGGVYTINWDALQGPVFFAPPGGGADPFFHVHTTPAEDGFFFGVEAYTVYGTAWTGQLGEFTIDCSPTGTGICVHFDPDGPGPIGDLGADFMVTGDVEIIQADAEGFVAIFSNVAFSDGSTIPGPFTVTG